MTRLKIKDAGGNDVSAYIAKASAPAQLTMKNLRAIIKAASPKAQERISYGIPFYEYRVPGYTGRMAYFAAAQHHIGFYIIPEKLPPALAKAVARYKHAKATLHFPIGKKVPATLVRQLIRLRMKEIDQALAKKAKKIKP